MTDKQESCLLFGESWDEVDSLMAFEGFDEFFGYFWKSTLKRARNVRHCLLQANANNGCLRDLDIVFISSIDCCSK
jgi:hypothetical protein